MEKAFILFHQSLIVNNLATSEAFSTILVSIESSKPGVDY